MEEEYSFDHSSTCAVIYPTSDVSQSLLSDPNIASSPSTSAEQPSWPSRARWTRSCTVLTQNLDGMCQSVVSCTDDLSVSVSSASSRISCKQTDVEEQVQLPKELVRTRIKVHMEGVAVGRSVDLSVLSGYDELIHVVDEIFDMKGELTPRIKWQLVYKDDEGDMMLLGDYPWTEFCEMVRKLYIYSSEKMKKKYS